MIKFNASNSLVGIEVRSLKHHRIPPFNRCSVQRELRFYRKRTQNVDLPVSVGPAIIPVNGCLNLTPPHRRSQNDAPATQPVYLYPNETDVLPSPICLLKNATL